MVTRASYRGAQRGGVRERGAEDRRQPGPLGAAACISQLRWCHRASLPVGVVDRLDERGDDPARPDVPTPCSRWAGRRKKRPDGWGGDLPAVTSVLTDGGA